jgi:RNA polymerase sigma factor (sigma-70 family)
MTDTDAEAVIRDFLGNEPGTVARLAEWARSTARHRAWGTETPEDVVQSTLLALVDNFRRGRFIGANLEAYVRRIARNQCLDAYRRACVRRSHAEVVQREPPPSAPFGLDPERRVDLRRAFEAMEEACRELVVLAYFYGYSRKEIGRLQRISETLVKVRLFRCLERVRQRLDPGRGGILAEPGVAGRQPS